MLGGITVYVDNGSYWFDANGSGTIETQFWIDEGGTVWYDINNNGAGDTIVPPSHPEGYP